MESSDTSGRKQARDVLLGGLAQPRVPRLRLGGRRRSSTDDELDVVRRVGKLVNLQRRARRRRRSPGSVGIGHTRWATHGKPSEENAHPHIDCTGAIAVVHNGIIENYARAARGARGRRATSLRSETDTETVAHLVESYYEGDLAEAVAQADRAARGQLRARRRAPRPPRHRSSPRARTRRSSSASGEGENIVASDIPAVLEYTREVLVLDDGEVAIVTRGRRRRSSTPDGATVEPEMMHVEWDLDAAEKGGYEDFMLKEIFEQPKAIRETLRGRMGDDGGIQLSELDMTDDEIRAIDASSSSRAARATTPAC